MTLGRRPQTRIAVLIWLQSHPGLHTAGEIADALGRQKGNIEVNLRRLIDEGHVVRGVRGKYMAL